MRSIPLVLVFLLATFVRAEGIIDVGSQSPEQLHHLEKQLIARHFTEPEARKMIDTMVAAHFSMQEMEQVSDRMADTDRLVRESVIEKIKEGTVKGVHPQLIIVAAEKVLNRMESAARLAAELRLTDDTKIIDTLADSLAAGLSREHATQLVGALQTAGETRRDRELTYETFLCARDMARRQVPSGTVADVLGSAVSRSHTSVEDMKELRDAFRSTSGDPEQQAKLLGESIAHGAHFGGSHGTVGNAEGSGRAGTGSGGSGGGSGGGGGGGGGGR